MRRLLLCILALSVVTFYAYGQTEGGIVMEYIIEDGDTIFIDNLPPAYKYVKPPRGKKGKVWREYYKLVHNFARVYPYALIAKDKVLEAEAHIKDNKLNKRERERYMTAFQEELFATFEDPLRNMTYTQGRILLRLIDRETGLTPFYIVRNYKGRAAAGFWQGVAKLFGADMKRPYDRFKEDKDIEELVQIYQRGEFSYLYATIFGKWPPEPVVRSEHDFPQKYGPQKGTSQKKATQPQKQQKKAQR